MTNFRDRPSRTIFKFTVLDGDFETTDGECAGEDDGAGVLANVDEAAAAIESAAEAARVDVAFLVALGHAEAGHVEAAAVVEIEHLVLIDDRVGIGRRAEARSAGEHAANGAGFRRHRDVRRDLLFVRDGRNSVGSPDAEIDDAVRRQLEGSAARDDLARVERHFRHIVDRNANLAGQCRVVHHAVVHAVHARAR